MRKVIILDSAKKDYAEINQYLLREFGPLTWKNINIEWKDKLQRIAASPQIGADLHELAGTGFGNFKKFCHKNVYAVYAFNEAEIVVYMFIPAMRDFRTHLMHRLLGA